MDSTYKEFIVPNGILYPQKADSVKIYPGENRVKITWQKGNDPKVIGAWIYWNNYTDSLHVDIPANSDRLLSAMIENLEETSHTFQIKTYDADGNVSIASEASSRVYGSDYRLSLFTRELTGNKTFPDRVELSWRSAPSSMLQFVLKYRTSSDVPVELIIPPDESKTIITDHKPLSAFTTESHYLPVATAIDTFKVIGNYEFLPVMALLNKPEWRVISCSDEQSGYGISAIIDGILNANNFWHSRWSAPVGQLPHWAVIDMVSPQKINRTETYRRFNVANTKTVQYYVGNDPDPNATSWVKIMEGMFADSGDLLTLDALENTLQGRYLKMVLTDSYGGEPHAAISEIYVYSK
jgi:hypothetical protein